MIYIHNAGLDAMIQNLEIQRQQLIHSLSDAGVHDKCVLDAIASISRECFVDKPYREVAYANSALPLAMGQTISQPLMVALMTQALQLTGSERVLEIGTGSGYQAAILSRLAVHVYSVERHQQLSYQAAKRLMQVGVDNVSLYVGDGTLGWPDQAPYDRILVTAAALEVPSQLLAQLAPHGILVIPVGSQDRQELQVIKRTFFGTQSCSLGGCVFVPLVGASGWSE